MAFSAEKSWEWALEPAPDRHAVPVDAEFLVFDRAFAILDALLQFGQEDLVDIDGLLGSAAHHGRPHERRAVEKSNGGGLGCGRVQDFLPQLRTLPGEGDGSFQVVQLELLPGNLLQRRDQRLELFGDGVDVLVGDLVTPR